VSKCLGNALVGVAGNWSGRIRPSLSSYKAARVASSREIATRTGTPIRIQSSNQKLLTHV
jgi:hypothetical protein